MIAYTFNRPLPPCPNCGHLRPGRRASQGSSSWGHGHFCCSDACGRRLALKIEHGMVELPPALSIHGEELLAYWHNGRVQRLRDEIRWLRYQIKRPLPEAKR